MDTPVRRERPVALAVVGDGARVGLGGVRRGGRAAAVPLDPAPGVVAVAADARAGRAPSPRPPPGRGRRRRSGRAAPGPGGAAAPRRSPAGCTRRPAGPRSGASGARRSRRRPPAPARQGAGSRWSRAASTPSPSYALVPVAHSARIVTIARSSSSRRSPARGNGSPYAACSRAHQPAPIPTKARPPVSAERVAAAFAVTPAGRKVTGVHSVPRSRPVPSPASAPSVTHGSGIGSHARPTWGIWIRWSISARPAKPASSAARATSPSQASGSSPHGNRETWSTSRSPWLVVRSAAGTVRGRARVARPGPRRPRRRPRGPSPPPRAPAVRRAPCGAGRPARAPARGGPGRRCGAGTRRPGSPAARPPLAGRPATRPRASRAGAPGSRPRVSTTVVRPRPRRAATTVSSRANASSEASRSCGPLPTTPRSASEETTSCAR